MADKLRSEGCIVIAPGDAMTMQLKDELENCLDVLIFENMRAAAEAAEDAGLVLRSTTVEEEYIPIKHNACYNKNKNEGAVEIMSDIGFFDNLAEREEMTMILDLLK